MPCCLRLQSALPPSAISHDLKYSGGPSRRAAVQKICAPLTQRLSALNMEIVNLPPSRVAPDPNVEMCLVGAREWRQDSSLRKSVWKSLCRKDDPAPMTVRIGSMPSRRVCSNVAEAMGPGKKIVRGWKILRLVVPNRTHGVYWQAVAHLLISGTDGRVLDVSNDERAVNSCYVFVASSRVAATVSDEVLTAGGLVLPSVVGGEEHYKELMMRHFSNVLALTPEEALPRPIKTVHIPVGMTMWAAERHPHADVVVLAQQLGIVRDEDVQTGDRNVYGNSYFYEQLSTIEQMSTAEEAQNALYRLLDDMFDSWTERMCQCDQDSVAVAYDAFDIASGMKWEWN